MTTAIAFRDVSKRYRLGEVGTGTLSHDLHRTWARLRGKPDPFALVGAINDREEAGGEYVWALKDVSFKVQQGEILGIIGRNGAGKSTLLKLLSRVTAPTSGEIKARGRIASLLEVGTGFHPELTGRENIYLNGAILGMSRREIAGQLDAIIEFSGCAKYIDTPVKRYSSGMTVRLGFAVAAHLQCEILVVDEVLAVGDAEFQRKCIGKMRDVGSQGRTILLISHNMASISTLCKRTILLDQGSIVLDGETSDVVLRHISGDGMSTGAAKAGIGNANGQLIGAWTESTDGTRRTSFSIDDAFTVAMTYRVTTELPVAPYPNFHFFDERGQTVFVTSSRNDAARVPGVYQAQCHVPANLLNDGPYFIGVALTATHDGIDVCFFDREALCVNIVEPLSSKEVNGPPRFGYGGPIPGVVRPSLQWTIKKKAPDEKELV